MKLGLIVSAAFWTAVVVWGFWGWAAFCAVSFTALWFSAKKEH